MTFEELDLEDEILDGLWDMNFRECTPIQEQAIPLLLEGKDLIGCAQTGTGKTAAYLLPILNDLLIEHDDHEEAIHAVIMVPTRELAQQIDQQVQGFAYYLPVSSVAVYGGSDGMVWEQQKKGIDSAADIVIATPGRLLSYLKLGLIDLSRVTHFVLDEADRMLDMGFVDDIMQVIASIPKQRQTMLFSATMPPKIRALAKQILHEPAEIRLSVSKPNSNITQLACLCYEAQKPALVQHLLKDLKSTEKVIIFASSKIKVKEVARLLKSMKLNVIEMHSDLEQSVREEVMLSFKSGQQNVLVATDIVARGIDIEDITIVINYDVPHDPEDYVHRIGRTARAGEKGSGITFVEEEEQLRFAQIEEFLEKEIDKMPLPEALGEGPEYHPQRFKKKKKSGHRRKRNGNGGGNNKRSGNGNAGGNDKRSGNAGENGGSKNNGRRHAGKNEQRDKGKADNKANADNNADHAAAADKPRHSKNKYRHHHKRKEGSPQES
ncbi:MAG: DEAD/DEAH box helicase [Bacteroidales bacterium]|nr:DEAD/DEAH box helicase [Bacteroidales bacterium]